MTEMMGAPRVKTLREFSDFSYFYVYVIFEDGTDIYWARPRTLEYLSAVWARFNPRPRAGAVPNTMLQQVSA